MYRSSGRIALLLKLVSKFLWIPLNKAHVSVSLCLTEGCVAGKTKPLPRSAYVAYRPVYFSPNVHLPRLRFFFCSFCFLIAEQNIPGDSRHWQHTDLRLCAALVNEIVSHALAVGMAGEKSWDSLNVYVAWSEL